MKIIKINESQEKVSQSQELYNKLISAFSSQTQEIQTVVQPLLSQAVYVQNALDDIRKRANNSKDNMDYYIKLLKEFSDIIQKLIDTLKN